MTVEVVQPVLVSAGVTSNCLVDHDFYRQCMVPSSFEFGTSLFYWTRRFAKIDEQGNSSSKADMATSPSNRDPNVSSSEAMPSLETIQGPRDHAASPTHQWLSALMSFLFHLVVFVGLVLLMVSLPNEGSGEVENRTGGIVLVQANTQTTEYLSEGEVLETASAASAAAKSQTSSAVELPPELPGVGGQSNLLQSAAESIRNGIDGIGDMTLNQSNAEIGGKVTTEVFGIKGTGSRFVYVFDRSESMSDDSSRPMLAAKQQLIESIQSLHENHRFQIIFYNHQTKIFDADGIPDMYGANEEIKEKAIRFVQSVRPDGGTDHKQALLLAFDLRPDVIFFLTDAEGSFSQADLDQLNRKNRSAAVVNMIEFGKGSGGDRSLQAVARESGGQYMFKNINSLRTNGQQ